MKSNGEQVIDADALAKMARISNLADSEEYKLSVFQQVENAFVLSFISKSQRDAIFSILFVGDRL